MSETRRPAKTRVGFVSLGCPKNLVDSEVMLGLLSLNGYQITPDKTEADVVVVNTCGFIDSAKEESIETILEMAHLKDEGRCRRLVVAGCLAERYREEILKEIPEVDFVFGPDELGRVLEAVHGGPPAAPELVMDALYTSRQVPTIPRMRTTSRHMAYLKISEGCDHTCAFCAIPGFRGRFRSRPLEDLVRETRSLVQDGVREVILVSQDTLAYGKDIGLEGGIEALLEALLEIDDLAWIRLLYAYPNLLSNSLIDQISAQDRLCSYFDIPYQHASASVLERMRRGGNRRVFERQLARIRAAIPRAGIRTSFIVGFPGETDEDFQELLEFMTEARFESVGVFVYSDEEGTAASNLDRKVPRALALERRALLMERQRELVKAGLDAMRGARVELLLEGRSPESELLLEGRMETQAPEIDGRVLVNDASIDDLEDGRFYLAEITGSLEYDLLGRIVARV